MNHKPKSRIVLEELREDKPKKTFSISIVQEEAPQDRVINIPLPHYSGKNIVTQDDIEMQRADTINVGSTTRIG